jgi:hypothetical protein
MPDIWHAARAGSRRRVCLKEVQEGFVFGQPDHHLPLKGGWRGGLAIWSQGWK